MKTLILIFLAVQNLSAADKTAPAAPPAPAAAAADPYLWLEEVNGEKAIAWARARNKETLDELQADPRYQVFYDKTLEVLDDNDRIPHVAMRGDSVYNFWQGADQIKGLWRRAPLAEYLARSPAWEAVLDIDKLSMDESENWVYKGPSCLPPENRLCLLALSRGGKDASVLREFDAVRKEFLKDGFRLEESKSGADWLDADTLLLADALSPESLTASGYPRVVREWKRGTDPKTAPVLFEGKKEDVAAGAWCSFRPEAKHCFITRSISFYESEHYLLSGKELKKLPLPPDAAVSGIFNRRVVFTLRGDWKLQGKTFKQNSLLSVELDKAGLPEEQADPELLFEPGPRATVEGVRFSRQALLLSLLDNVKGKILKLTPGTGGLKTEEVPVPPNGSAYVDTSEEYRDDFLFAYQNFLVPASLFYSGTGEKPVKQNKPKFDASRFETDQREAVSADGTKIPYFIVYPRGMKPDGKNPALLYGYGGFESSMNPFYSGITGRLWLEQGGVYALANIRGGGEFGPAWHKAALRENRQKAFDDFIAVAEDLVKTGVTSPAHLGIEGGSNGGLLMGAMFTQRPDLFRAVLCEVPLLDMLRYTKLPPGASWVGEYGDPDSAELGPVIAKYSPYQNIRPGVKYPDIFFLTSTKDDRVHPGHARKAAARLIGFGNKVYYYENIDGGHSAAANNPETAKRLALEYVLLSKKLKD
ncbi:MAG: S9 family peptidase [Elusimicrobia bacterium]|nr:S9 family peptidase [Elusimicrobiota bacterium]